MELFQYKYFTSVPKSRTSPSIFQIFGKGSIVVHQINLRSPKTAVTILKRPNEGLAELLKMRLLNKSDETLGSIKW